MRLDTNHTIVNTGNDQVNIDGPVNIKSNHPSAFSLPTGENEERDELLDTKFIRVDSVLTGGYAMDTVGNPLPPTDEAETPKRSNTHFLSEVDKLSEELESKCTMEKSVEQDPSTQHLGYLLSHQNNAEIVEELKTVPKSETGRFLYQIMSSTPLPILTGPSFDAPKTKAMLLPGTKHEVSLRVSLDPDGDGIYFLRLSHRRGWIADRKISRAASGRKIHSVPVVKEIIAGASQEDESIASYSVNSSIAISSISAATISSVVSRMRHRPPRRQRENTKVAVEKALPRNISGGVNKGQSVSTPVKGKKSDDSVLLSPTSNVSMISDDDSTDQSSATRQSWQASKSANVAPASKSGASQISHVPTQRYCLFRVTAPFGLKILDTPQFQVNNLIHGRHSAIGSSQSVSKVDGPKPHHSIFQTMSSRLTTTGPSMTNHSAIFDSSLKARILPRGVLFEASGRMESTGAFSQGAGLIKLSDNSGWAIVPRRDELDAQYRHLQLNGMLGHPECETLSAFEEVGNALLSECNMAAMEYSTQTDRQKTLWLRVHARGGAQIVLPPPIAPLSPDNNEATSPTSSRGSSTITDTNSAYLRSKDSDVASSVGSSFLDTMFRTPKKTQRSETYRDQQPSRAQAPPLQPHQWSNTIACGMIVEVDQAENFPPSMPTNSHETYMRLRGGQGWIPTTLSGKHVSSIVPHPEIRHGSFWFRVQSMDGIRVRLGPSKRAPSIKSDEGAYFRFECGEFLRASEIITVFGESGEPTECFAKLFRNRHARLQRSEEEFRSFQSLTVQSEWVHVYDEKELFLEECAVEPRIERHKQGWRYTVAPEVKVAIRRGPSFAAGKTGAVLFAGDTVATTERVRPSGDKITWLRMKDGSGWIHDFSDQGEELLIAHSLRQKVQVVGGAPHKQRRPEKKNEIAYNTIVARLFHNETGDHDAFRPSKEFKGLR
jgi:hypothetical protein